MLFSLCACGSTESSEAAQSELSNGEASAEDSVQVQPADSFQSEEAWVPPGIVTVFVSDVSGSYADKCARILSKYAEKYIGQKIVIKNTENFDTLSERLLQSDSNGTYIAFADMTPFIDAAVESSAPELSGMKVICGNAADAYAVVVRSNEERFHSIDELSEYAWDQEEPLVFATNGEEQAFHTGAKLFAEAEDFDFIPLHKEDRTAALEALLLGDADCCVLNLSSLGKYRSYTKVLGLLSSERSEIKKYSTVPTLLELGCDDAVMPIAMHCVFINQKAPDEAVAFYEEAFRLAMLDPDFVNAMTKYNVAYSGSEETEELLTELIEFINTAPQIFEQ